MVGGSAATASFLVWRQHTLGRLAAIIAAGLIVRYEVVEVLVIGFASDVARNLQILYLGVGSGIAGLASSWTEYRCVGARAFTARP
jgi:hypothetical protein